MKNQTVYSIPNLKTKILLLSFYALLSITLLSSQKAFAQSSLNIGTSPSSEKLQLQPGDTYNGEVVVWNLSETTTDYDIYIRGFKQVENQPGTAIMLTEDEERRSLYTASSWITMNESSIELVPNKNEKLFYQIRVPEDATKGEYNAIIAFLSEYQARSLGTTAFTNLSAGTPILIKIGDDFVENAELLKFDTGKNFYENTDLDFETIIKNLGDTHITPSGEIILTNILDQEVARISFNPNRQSILRDNTGLYETIWNLGSFLNADNKIVMGPIDAKLIVTYRNFQPGFAPLTSEITFWILPWKHILIGILLLLTVLTILKTRKKKEKRLPK